MANIDFVLSLAVIALGITGFYFLLKRKQPYFPIPCYYVSATLIYIAAYFIFESFSQTWYELPALMIISTGVVYSMLVDKFTGVVFGPALTMIFTVLGALILKSNESIIIRLAGAGAGLAIGYIIIFILRRKNDTSRNI